MLGKIFLPLEILSILIRGWMHLGWVIYKKILEFFLGKSLPEKFFFLFLGIQLITSAMGWIQYSIVFNDTTETINLSVGWNVIFILGSLINYFFTGFWRSNWVWFLFLGIQTILIGLFAWGSLDTKLAFTNILSKQDYRFSVSYYLFGTSLVLSWALGIAIYLNERKKQIWVSKT